MNTLKSIINVLFVVVFIVSLNGCGKDEMLTKKKVGHFTIKNRTVIDVGNGYIMGIDNDQREGFAYSVSPFKGSSGSNTDIIFVGEKTAYTTLVDVYLNSEVTLYEYDLNKNGETKLLKTEVVSIKDLMK